MNMENKPKYLVRPHDHCIFSLNEDGCTYSTYEGKKNFPDSLHNTYDYDLLKDYNFYEATEADFSDIDKKRAEYCAFMVWYNRNDGHGGIKGGTIEEYRRINSLTALK